MTEETQKKISKWFWRIITFPVLLLLFMILLVWAFADIPSFKELENPESKLATQIIAEGGEVLTTFHIENRTYVTYEELSPNVVHAAIATEDARFYRHSGIDFKGLARVLFKTILMRNSSQGGGSTITQQLAKTLYPRSEAHSKIPGAYQVKMVWIKLKEWITAVKLEKNYTKDEIMTMYLNSIFFGSNAYGIRSASETFFGKQPSELTIEEAATLIGMANKPTRYNPALNPDKSLARRNFVIGQMEKAGYIDKHQRDSIREIPIELSYQVLDHNAFTVDSLAWSNCVLFGWIEKNRKADGSQYDLDRDGLRIYTTINYKMQQYAEEAVAERIKALQKDFDRELRYKRNPPFANDIDQPTREKLMNQARKWSDRWRMLKKSGLTEAQILKTFSEPEKMRVFAYNNKGYIDTTMTPDDSIRYYKSLLRTSFVAMEPGTGRVKAYVGGPNYRYFKYDNVRQGKRQVGSTIKPFLYTLAMQEGMNPCTQVVNLPQTFVTPSGTWTPRSTDSERWIGATVSLKWGITNSSNNISAYLMKQFGPHAMVAMMRRMGIMSHVDAVPALCVGPADIALWDMVAAYNTFPSKGVFIEPLFVLSEFSNRKTEAISDATAYLMVNLMKGVVEEGTAQRLRSRYNLTGEMAGKTGTTNDNSDGWFIGYTPTIVAGCWTGCEDRQVHFQSTALGQGANASLPTWAIFMKKVWADGTLGVTRDDKFSAPAGMEGSDGCEGGGDGGASVSVAQERIEDYYFE